MLRHCTQKLRKNPVLSRLVFVVLVYFCCFAIESKWYYGLPTFSKDSLFDEESVTKTREILNKLTIDYKNRISGTKGNDIDARDYILSIIDDIKSQSSPNVKIEVDVQNPTGDFFLGFLNGFTNAYCNITNIVVRLSPSNENPNDISNIDTSSPPSILINSHFDTFVLSGGGASDDATGVSLMLQVLRLMSSAKSSNSFIIKNPIIFLFNGAEESILQGSHGFITQHPWASNIRTLVNLEAIGSGGRELVFQCNSAWMASFYGQHVPFPYSSSLAHELFQAVLWKAAATDWRAFIEFGNRGIVGIDTAYVTNGYVYHTSFDTAKIIPDGTLINTGSNLLALTSALASCPEISLPIDEWLVLNGKQVTPTGEVINKYNGNFIFLDMLGFFHIVYSGLSIYLIHFLVVILSIWLCFYVTRGMSWSILFQSLKSSYGYLLRDIMWGVVTGAVYTVVAPMRWYDGGVNTCLLIFVPVFCLAELMVPLRSLFHVGYNIINSPPRTTTTATSKLAQEDMYKITHVDKIVSTEVSGLLFWTSLLFFSSLCSLKGSILYLLWTMAGICCVVYTHALKSFTTTIPGSANSGNSSMGSTAVMSPRPWLPSLFLVLPIVVWLRVMRLTLDMLLPLLGKSGTVIPGDILLGAVLGILFGSLFRLPLMHRDFVFFGEVRGGTYMYMGDKKVRSLTDIHTHAEDDDSADDSRSSQSYSTSNSNSNGNISGRYLHFTSIAFVLFAYILLSLLYFTVLSTSFSPARPKRLWIQHLDRDLRGIGGTRDSGVWIAGFDHQGVTATSQWSQWSHEVGWLEKGTYFYQFHREFASTPIHQSLSVQGKQREGEGGDYIFHNNRANGFNCDTSIGECYLYWPYYFPAADVLKSSIYIPTTEPLKLQNRDLDESSKRFQLFVNPTSSVKLENEQLQIILGNEALSSLKHQSGFGGYRRVSVVVTGPTHMTFIIKDNQFGNRILRWGIEQTTQGYVGDNDAERGKVINAFMNKRLNRDMVSPNPTRDGEGVHYLHVGFGMCHGACMLRVDLVVSGLEKIQIAAYGHYVLLRDTKELLDITDKLPEWSVGAEWTNFVSNIVATNV